MSKPLLTIFDGLYQSKVGAKYPVHQGKDGALLKGLRAIYSDEDIARYMRAFFEIEDEFIQNSGYSIGCFRGCLPKVIAWANKVQKRPAALGPEYTTRDWCPHVVRCATRFDCKIATQLGREERQAS